jgi:DMSO reductase anchor subunit
MTVCRVLGFLLGVSLTGSAAGVYLLDSYSSSSQSLVGAMDQLKATVCQVKGAVAKMDTLESGVNDLQESKASLLDLEKRRQELLKVIVSLSLSISAACSAAFW